MAADFAAAPRGFVTLPSRHEHVPRLHAARPAGSRVSAGSVHFMDRPLPFGAIARAAQVGEERVGPSGTMAAVTGLMRVQQIVQSAVDGALKPHGLPFGRY